MPNDCFCMKLMMTGLLLLLTAIYKEYSLQGNLARTPFVMIIYESINHPFMFYITGCSSRNQVIYNVIFRYLNLVHKVLIKHVKCAKTTSMLSMT